MKILFLSDTHECHHRLTGLPDADMIIHGGDITDRGNPLEVKDFMEWFSALEYTYKIFIAGNHDVCFEHNRPEDIRKTLPEGIIYLCDSGVCVEGVNIWGSPVVPVIHSFPKWAFERERGSGLIPK